MVKLKIGLVFVVFTIVVILNPAYADSEETNTKLPAWIQSNFVWYANGDISETELLTAIKYLILAGIIDVPAVDEGETPCSMLYEDMFNHILAMSVQSKIAERLAVTSEAYPEIADEYVTVAVFNALQKLSEASQLELFDIQEQIRLQQCQLNSDQKLLWEFLQEYLKK